MKLSGNLPSRLSLVVWHEKSNKIATSLRKMGWLEMPPNPASAKSGDIVFFRQGNRELAHVEIVYKVHKNNLCSIGGNVGNRVSGRCISLERNKNQLFGQISL